VAGKTDPSLTRAIPERLRDEQLVIKRYTIKARPPIKTPPPEAQPSQRIKMFGVRNLDSLGYRMALFLTLRDPVFCRFGRAPTCDGQRDRQTDGWTDTGLYSIYGARIKCGL